jgi:cysteine desulfurase
VARLVDCDPGNVIFTSGATESLNLAIRGTLMALPRGQFIRVAISPYEHSAVIETCMALRRRGVINELIVLSGDRLGRVNMAEVDALCREGLSLLCVMAANNEIGTIQPIMVISEICRRYGVPYLCDATQAAGRLPISVRRWQIPLLALSSHKLYGPQGIGALICRRHSLSPILYGGGAVRPGTQNVAGIVGFGEACRLRRLERSADERRIGELRALMEKRLLQGVAKIKINGDRLNRLPGNLHFSVPYVNGAALVDTLKDKVACSTGSACSHGAPSHVLGAIGLTPDEIRGSIRIGIGKFNTETQIQSAATRIIGAILEQRIAHPFSSVSCGCFE